MTYLGLTAVVLLLVLAVVIPLRRPVSLGAVALAGAALILLTAVFDNIMIAVGFFHYADEPLSGLSIGLAPIEDFSYPIAGVLLLPALWHLLLRRRGRPAAEEGSL
ncbi:lycopene cyclase domain-containing protein [Nesterenkonia aerolata]|uniref:Lycopene cyclase domain-containing protein n=1 Tax=Nesterenkonia aerolata TaxID=3074079 RepID=A0ABU2DVJ0_9MICC|nr:lycopene cyclase domain-containing protein [Nesterenkonia sp. LY-0111]MDR8020385.1 lycopene cyclase domain-containing protein [Nesterenkonia sp. LY-0111]